jgi:choline-sulfatase
MAAGQLASRIGAFDNAVEFPASIPTYAHYLRDLGYQTCLSGKMHFVGPDQLHGFEGRLTADIYPSDFSWAPNWVDEGQRDTSDTTGVTVSGICARSVQIDYDDEVKNKAVQQLYDYARSSDARPFFLQVSFTHPHDPYLCSREHWQRYEGIDIPPPATGAMPAAEHDIHSQRILAQHSMLDFEFDPADIARARRAYYGSISYIDDCVGELLKTLELTGQSNNTVIVFTSDHGEMLGERGMWFKKTFFEHALRVPLIISMPGTTHARRVSTNVSLVDLLPTFNTLATGKPWHTDIEPLDGENILKYGEQHIDRAIYAEYLSETTPAPIFMIRRGEHKFISSSADPDLLFDLSTDPHERHNIAAQPNHTDSVTRFRNEIEQHWNATTLTEEILLSQRRRQLLIRAMAKGSTQRWDHNEHPGQQVLWYRGEQGYNTWAYDYLPDAG